MFFSTLFMVRGYCHNTEYKCQTGEDQGLEQAEQRLKSVEDRGNHQCYQEGHNADQDFTGCHIAE